MPLVTNQFWIAANIIFDVSTGDRRNVLMLVNRPDDATVFPSEADARRYFMFVTPRAPEIQWSLEPPNPQRPQGWVIRGLQSVNV